MAASRGRVLRSERDRFGGRIGLRIEAMRRELARRAIVLKPDEGVLLKPNEAARRGIELVRRQILHFVLTIRRHDMSSVVSDGHQGPPPWLVTARLNEVRDLCHSEKRLLSRFQMERAKLPGGGPAGANKGRACNASASPFGRASRARRALTRAPQGEE